MTDPEHRISDLEVDPSLLAVLEAAVDALVVIDDLGNMRWISPNTTTLLDRSLRELRSVAALDLVAEEDRELAAMELGQVYAGTDSDRPPVTLRLLRSDGSTVWVELTSSDLRDDPAIRGVVLAARDVSHRFELEAALAESEHRFEAMVRHSSDVLVLLDRDGRIDYVSPSVRRLSGYEPEQLIGLDVRVAVSKVSMREFEEAFARVTAEPGAVESLRLLIPHEQGRGWWAEVHVTNRLDDPVIGCLIANLRDVTEIVEAETRAAQLTEIFDLTEDLVCVVDGESRLQYLNPAGQKFLGLTGEHLERAIGNEWKLTGLDRSDGGCALSGGERRWVHDVDLTDADGTVVPFRMQIIAHMDSSHVVQRYSAVAHDISESHRLASSLERQAMHDPLTGLPNRKLLERRMRELRESGTEMAVLFIDLDDFKVINDSLGHAFGDRVLDAVASRLRNVVRSVDVVARFGGDEFVVLCEGVAGVAGAKDIASRVVAAVVQPLVIAGTPVHIGASIGIAEDLDPASRSDPAELIRDADTAMYQAKAKGRGRVVTFDEDLRRRAVERQRIETALRRAPSDGSLELHYQPVVDSSSGQLRYIEALLRWRNGDVLLGPAQFVPVAEDTDLIVPLGAWVLEAALGDLARWQSMPGWDRLGLSVNASVRQLQRAEFGEFVQKMLQRHHVDPTTLAVEITESVLLDQASLNAASITALHHAGVQLAIDDFGTGYSSLTYMAKLPVDIVKLDRTFLNNADDSNAGELVAAVLDLVGALGLYCVAEGVETQHQLDHLASLGCDAVQGYLIDRPMTASEIERVLARTGPEDPWPGEAEFGRCRLSGPSQRPGRSQA